MHVGSKESEAVAKLTHFKVGFKKTDNGEITGKGKQLPAWNKNSYKAMILKLTLQLAF